MTRRDSVKPIRYVRDARLAYRGDMIICQQQWAEVIGVRYHEQAPPDAPVMGNAVEVVTERGSRWFGYEYYHRGHSHGISRDNPLYKARNNSEEVASG